MTIRTSRQWISKASWVATSRKTGVSMLSGRYFDTHGRLPNQRLRQADITLKTAYNITNDIKLDAFGILNDKGQLFGWKNTDYNDRFRYFLEGVPKSNGLDYVGSLKLTHVLSPEHVLRSAGEPDVQGLQTYGYTDANGDGVCDLNEDGEFLDDGRHAHRSASTSRRPARSSASSSVSATKRHRPSSGLQARSATSRSGSRVRSSSMTRSRPSRTPLRADITSQVNFNHQFKAGVQLKLHDLSRTERNSTLGADVADLAFAVCSLRSGSSIRASSASMHRTAWSLAAWC